MFEASFQVSLYYNIIFIIIIITCSLISIKPKLLDVKSNVSIAVLLLITVILFIGYREWWRMDVFYDSLNYGEWYLSADWDKLLTSNDIGFNVFYTLINKLGFNVDFYFILCAVLYTYPLFLVAKRLSVTYYIVFLFIIASMSFYPYGVNGIRNGIATSFVLLALTYTRFAIKQIFLILIALSFHLSVLIPVGCYYVSKYLSLKRVYMFWILCIPTSFILYPIIADISGNLSFLNERSSSYLTNEDLSLFSKSGFRYDFIIYSCIPIFINRFSLKNDTDKSINSVYLLLLKTYILANAFWIIINPISFSNRFAYLSWFIMPVVIIYPLLQYPIYPKIKGLTVSFVLLFYFLLTYILL